MDGFGVDTPDRFAGYTHNHLAQAIGQLDTKVSILLGLTSGALVYLVQNMTVYSSAHEVLTRRLQAGLEMHEVLALLAAALLVISFLASLISIMPKFGKDRRSIIYYGGITKVKSADDFADQVTAYSGDELTRAVLKDTHSLAKIAKRKAIYAAYASRFIALGLPVLIVAAVFRTVAL